MGIKTPNLVLDSTMSTEINAQMIVTEYKIFRWEWIKVTAKVILLLLVINAGLKEIVPTNLNLLFSGLTIAYVIGVILTVKDADRRMKSIVYVLIGVKIKTII
ncbi:hypothetical protein [Photobacterium phosphoreum]|uniref:hypothetical protein n=1 Tax=Photobacterium phosphoreum TaxID=659 RepID=UPI001E5DC1DB|nr:hypothetical protein [Photobacterium phosphoreum]MCD9471327.1 hypothetical protein [Photobacterium phosphoreum]